MNDYDHNRAAKRDSLLLMARVTRSDGAQLGPARVRNLSARGVMAEFGQNLAPGDRVTLELRGLGEISARVSWSSKGRIGLQFDTEIDPRNARRPIGQPSRPAGGMAPVRHLV